MVLWSCLKSHGSHPACLKYIEHLDDKERVCLVTVDVVLFDSLRWQDPCRRC